MRQILPRTPTRVNPNLTPALSLRKDLRIVPPHKRRVPHISILRCGISQSPHLSQEEPPYWPLPLQLPLLLLLPLPVFRCHPERSEGPPYWQLQLPGAPHLDSEMWDLSIASSLSGRTSVLSPQTPLVNPHPTPHPPQTQHPQPLPPPTLLAHLLPSIVYPVNR
jgi:hypothetical protein